MKIKNSLPIFLFPVARFNFNLLARGVRAWCLIAFAFAAFHVETAVATPVVTADEQLIYTENQPPLIVSTNITVTDADSTNITGATVQITGNYQSDQDVLHFADTAEITGAFATDTGTLTLTGVTTVSNYQAALRTVTYRNTLDNPRGGSRTVTWTVTDDQPSSGGDTNTIVVRPVNDAPVITSVNSIKIIYGDTRPQPLGFSFVDVDAEDSPQIDFRIEITKSPTPNSGTFMTGFASNVPGATVQSNLIKWTSTVAQGSMYAANVVFVGGTAGYYEITVTVADNGFTGLPPLGIPGRSYPQTTIKIIPVIILSTVPGGVDLTSPTNTVQASSTNSPAGQEATQAIDNTAASKYLNFDKLNTGLVISTAATNIVRGLTLVSAEDVPERNPANFILAGSLDGANFTFIASNTIPAFASTNCIQSFSFSNETAYSSYRLTFPTVSNAAAASSMQIAEIELLAHREITSTNDAVSVTLPLGAADVRGVARLTDHSLGLTNKFEIAPIPAGNNTVVDIAPAIGATILTGFELIGGADDVLYPERRPTSVTIAGSVDGTNFITLTESIVPEAPSTNSWIQEYSCPGNDVVCLHYRITFGPPVSGNRLQLGELRLFGERYVSLAIAADAQQAALQWLPAAGFNLEQRTNLAVGTWTAVTNAPVQNSGTNTVLLLSDTTMKFFRLHDTNN